MPRYCSIAVCIKALLKDAMDTPEEARKVNILDYLKKRWIWNNILELPEVDKIKKWHEEASEPVKEKLRQLLENWGQLTEENA